MSEDELKIIDDINKTHELIYNYCAKILNSDVAVKPCTLIMMEHLSQSIFIENDFKFINNEPMLDFDLDKNLLFELNSKLVDIYQISQIFKFIKDETILKKALEEVENLNHKFNLSLL